MKQVKSLSIALAVLGLMGATLVIGWYGFDKISGAILSVGWLPFLVFCAWQSIVFMILGVGWWLIIPECGIARLPAFFWGRAVRDSAGCCLPFSQVGGFFLGARAASLHGVAWSVATIAMIVDLTAEFISELLFAVAGLIVLLNNKPDGSMSRTVGWGIAAALLLCALVIVMQQKMVPFAVRFGKRILGDWFSHGLSQGSVSTDALARLYGDSRRLSAATLLHFFGWIGKGLGNWLAFHLLGSDLSLIGALAIEGLLHALLIPAFIVPGYAGVQEVGYAGIGALFGVPAELSIAVSLLRRARDISLGIPILLFWQFVEMRRLRGTPETPTV